MATLLRRGYHCPNHDGSWFNGLPERQAQAEFERLYGILPRMDVDIMDATAEEYVVFHNDGRDHQRHLSTVGRVVDGWRCKVYAKREWAVQD